MPKLIEDGHIFIAQPPLYKVAKGKQEHYVYSDEELQEVLEEVGRDNAVIQRYKGYGKSPSPYESFQ